MNKSAIVLAGTLVACVPRGAIDTTLDLLNLPERAESYEQAQAQVQADLAALDQLELFEVDGMNVTAEMVPNVCYGPCPDDEVRMAAYVAQANRLHALLDLADDDVDALGPCYTTASSVVDQSLAAIAELEILDVGELILEEAESEPNCYNLPCPDEVARVEEANERRALQIWHLSERSSGI